MVTQIPVAAGGSPKVIHTMRHGTTEMNIYLTKNPYGSMGFKDPLFYDTRLTPQGKAGAQAAASTAKALTPKPEVLVVSPLTRAMQTADLAFAHYDGPVLVEPLARERVWLSSDVGRPPSELREEFQGSRYTFDHLPDIWWYNGGRRDPKHVVLEPEDVFEERVEKFRHWLLQRPERVIAVVAHWGLLMQLTGESYENCEIRSWQMCGEGKLTPLRSLSTLWRRPGGQ